MYTCVHVFYSMEQLLYCTDLLCGPSDCWIFTFPFLKNIFFYFNSGQTCVFQFVFNRRGFHLGHRSPARPMGGRQGDPASHRRK